MMRNVRDYDTENKVPVCVLSDTHSVNVNDLPNALVVLSTGNYISDIK